MKLALSGGYKKIDQLKLADGSAVAWISHSVEDLCWDKFLQETPLGQYQQSTIWARAKAAEGWNPVRVVLTVNEEVAGGFQVLWRSSWRGRIGYVSKGPVVLPNSPGLAEYSTRLLQQLGRSEKFRALVVQPPDLCAQMTPILAENGFIPDVLAGVNEATCIVDLRDGFEAAERKMSKETRKKAKQATGRGMSFREGTRQDIDTFFRLMLSTCQRQGVQPNPANVQALLALWDSAWPAGGIRLFLAECEGTPITGQLCIPFGQTVTFWKTGWTSTEGRRYPNDFTLYETLKWASSNGYEVGDFSSMDKRMAIAMLNGKPLSPEQERNRSMIHLRFGATPRLLPRSMVYFPNPAFRLAYRALFYKKIKQANEL